MTNTKSSVRIVFRDKFMNNFDGVFLRENVSNIGSRFGDTIKPNEVSLVAIMKANISDDGAVAKVAALFVMLGGKEK